MAAQRPHLIRYRVLDPNRGNPVHEISVDATPKEIQALVEEGYFVRSGWFTAEHIAAMRQALDRIAAEEGDRSAVDPSSDCGGARYLRFLLDKDPVFLNLLRFEPALSVAQAVLGPLVRFDQVDGRYWVADAKRQHVGWHIHLRGVSVPMPPFFSYPHAVHMLLYLDEVNARNGPLCVLPRSHRRVTDIYEQGDSNDLPGQRVVPVAEGDCVIIHANLWHRSLPHIDRTVPRRLIVFGYMPAWMVGDEEGGLKPAIRPTEELRLHGDARIRALLGEFHWG
jgi:hypothetical protein